MPYYNRDPKRDHNFDNHPGVRYQRLRTSFAHGGTDLVGYAASLMLVLLKPTMEVALSPTCTKA